MAKLNTINIPIRVGIEYGHMDDDWNWIPFNSQKKGTEMIVSKELRETLISTAKEDYADKVNAHIAAQAAMNEARKVLDWAQGLRVGGELLSAPTSSPKYVNYNLESRYYVPSKSGLTKGHYIYRYFDSSVSCTCPGFINRGYCWASTKIKANRYAFETWKGSKSVFDNNRNLA